MVEVGLGDVVCFASNEEHWHSGVPDKFMVRVTINPAASTNGGTEWMEPVPEEHSEAGRPPSLR